ncbi:acyl-CoA dehydrogenase family protein [Desulfobacula sp.]|uniref:acyl-CoA dehydrogenase family protein n=1 Tax=Desulfobacula sp. TaxID=2593537 RepID=UPI0026110BAA|nr:acyl-CoA dehydrogenase family protein [Desulfobacula sp.]
MNLEHLLTKEHLQIRETIREFTKKEIMPRTRELEADYSLVEEVHQKLVDMGVQADGYPEEYGGGGHGSMKSLCIITEELAKGDAGISLSVGINAGIILKPAMVVENKFVMDQFIPRFTGDKLAYACISMTDEQGGADSENPLLAGGGIKTTARLEGDEYVINGAKSWPTHGGVAECYLTVCNTDPSAGDEGIALIYVPKDTPGLTFGKPEEKMLFKTSINSSIYYNNVRVPKEYRLAGPGMDANIYHFFEVGTGWHSSAMALGVAERAFELALAYTGTRMGGFKPVRQHSMVAGILADMAIGIDMMRASVYNLSCMLDNLDVYGPPWSPQLISKASATRVFAGDKAVEIVNKGAELLGSMAISKDFGYEKCLRDAKIFQLWLGGQQICRYRVARGYYDLKNWA